MARQLTVPSMVKWGKLSPSQIKFEVGTTPYSQGSKPFDYGDPNESVTQKQGRKWRDWSAIEGCHFQKEEKNGVYGRPVKGEKGQVFPDGRPELDLQL